MRKFFVLGLMILIGSVIWSQLPKDNYHYYLLSDVQHANPDTIFAIDLSKSKLLEVPQELSKFKNLKALRLSKNKLTQLPDFFTSFTSLQFLYADKNKFMSFPAQIFYLENLEYIDISRNQIDAIPVGIKNLTKLLYFDIWDNRLIFIDNAFISLQQIKFIDFRGTTFSPEFVDRWTQSFPNATVKFDPPCSCIK